MTPGAGNPGGRHDSLFHVTDSVIELDVSVPWEPPEPPAPRRRLQARWVAAAAVLVAALGVLVAAGPRSDAGRLYSVEVQVLQAQTAGGRLFIARYQGTAPGPMIEARRAATASCSGNTPPSCRSRWSWPAPTW